jgi:hypothetical protein
MEQDNQEPKISPLPIISPLQTSQIDEDKVPVIQHKVEKTTE